MKSPLANQFETQIRALKGLDFQHFVRELFLKVYGDEGFIPLRDSGDKGNDGIIKSKSCIIACYAPNKYDKKGFVAKMKSDFLFYREFWEKNYPNWMFVTNLDLSPEMDLEIIKLKRDASLIGPSAIIEKVLKLDGYKKRALGKYLNIDKDYFARDYLCEILDDLLRNSESDDKIIQYTPPAYLPDKIELNYEKNDIEAVWVEIDLVKDDFRLIQDIIHGYEDHQIKKIKDKIISGFNSKNGSFKERLELLTAQYLEKYSENDDDYRFYIRGLLFYHFEQCLIGLKTEAEKAGEEK